MTSTAPLVRVAEEWVRPSPELIARFAQYPVANLGDAMDRLGICDAGIVPVWNGARFVGSALPILTAAGDNAAIIDALEFIRPGDVVVVNGFGHLQRAVIGDNLTQRFAAHGAVGAVVDGCIRDRDIITELRFPMFSRGVTPAGPYKNGPGVIGSSIAVGGIVCNPGDIVAGDSDGVIIVPPARAEEVLAGAAQIAERELALDAEVAAMYAAASH
ncbi:RraA family protein [Rhodococcoides yunnanense]|uniref:RraA family protein n=1 Tax=Rhodococcoides yunnanense TaxID=278209 RepID=UPI000932B5A8|nr:methyltransferase [Rhodococcus yunnanensis]